MTGPAQRATVRLTAGAEALLRRLTGRRHVLTARGVDRLLRTARTIADLAGSDVVSDGELAEAAAYRALDRDPTSDPRRLLA